MSLMIGLDVGTSGTKGLLVDRDGQVLRNAFMEYSMSTPHPLWSEQDPEDWWGATKKVLKELSGYAETINRKIMSLGLTGQMHGLVLLDNKGTVLRPCIMWNDQRTGHECREMTEKIGFDRLLTLTGNPVLPGFTAPKLLWVKKHEPDVYSRISHILLPKDYIRFKLSGAFISDVSDASGTSLLDVNKRNWSTEILDRLDIPGDWLPRVVESPAPAGTVSRDAADMTGIPEGTVIAGGGGDQAAGAVGSGTVVPGVTSVVLGTSGVVFAHTDTLEIEKQGRLHAFCHAVPGSWHVMGVTLSAAGSLKWYRDLFTGWEKDLIYEQLTAESLDIPQGSEGLFFLPYLSGERTPYPDEKARGAFIGLNIRHRRGHFTRAVLEGVSYSLNDCLELIRGMNIPVKQVRVTGGGARSDLWKQILADTLNAEVVTLAVTEGAPFGAALLGGVAAGLYSDIRSACKTAVKTGKSTHPVMENVRIYSEFYRIYRTLYSTLKETNNSITGLVTRLEK